MSKLQEVTDLFEQMENQRKLFEDKIRETGKELVVELLEEIGDRYPGFAVVGYTPGFNDGDPCEHTEYIVDFDEVEDYGLEDHFEHLDFESSRGTLLPHEEKKLETVQNMFERYAREVHHTDYLIVAYRDDNGEIHFEVSDYDCGY